MSPTLTDSGVAASDPTDGLAVLEARGSIGGDVRHSAGGACGDHASLSAALPLLLQSASARGAGQRVNDGRLETRSQRGSGFGSFARRFFRRRTHGDCRIWSSSAAGEAGLYTNLITSALGLNPQRLEALKRAGLDSIQISFQSDESMADRIAGVSAHEIKLKAAQMVRESGLPLTVNVVLHRENIERLEQIIALAERLGAERLELANTQYYGWALKIGRCYCRRARKSRKPAASSRKPRARLKGMLAIDYVVPDYYALRPKKCMGGWGRQFFNISPAGKILPCHAAETITGLEFESRALQSFARLDLETFQCIQPVSRNGVDAGAVPELRVPGRRILAAAAARPMLLTGDPTPKPIPRARYRRCTSRFSSRPSSRPPPTTTASSIAISPAARWRRAATMAPDADAGKAARQPLRSLCAADLRNAAGRRRPRDLRGIRRPRRRHPRGVSAWRARQRLPARPPPAVRSRAFSRRAVRPARRRP